MITAQEQKNQEAIDFVWENYSYISNNFKKEQVEEFFLLYQDNIVKVYESGMISGVGFYLKLSDGVFEDVKNRVLDLTASEVARDALKEQGRNIHFIMAIGEGLRSIRQAIRKVVEKENPKTISWFSPDMKQFFLKKMR